MMSDVSPSGVFLTGITGALGSWLACKAVRAGWDVTALARGDDDGAARERVRAALDVAGAAELASQVRVVRGDLCEADIAERLARQMPARIDRVVHCAAGTKFDGPGAEGNHEVNVEGTRRVLDLARRCGLAMVYVSTAYVAGRRQGVVTEGEVDVGQEFNNIYEQTKLTAELDVRHWSHRCSLPAVILRPSIVMGESQTGITARFNPIYDFLRIVDMVVPHLESQVVRAAIRPGVTKNMIPMDYFADAAWQIIANETSGCYHLTNPRPHTMGQVGEIICELYGRRQFRLVEPSALEAQAQTPLEKAVNGATADYACYMADEPTFDRSHTDRALAESGIDLPAMGAEYFARLMDYARSVSWGKRRRRAVPS